MAAPKTKLEKQREYLAKAREVRAERIKQGLPVDLKKARKRLLKSISLERYQEIITVTLTENRRELLRLAKDPRLPSIQSGLARAMYNALKQGDVDVIEKLMSRIVGKIPDQVNLKAQTQNLNLNANAEVDEAKLRRIMAKIEDDV